MSLIDLITEIEATEMTLTVYNADQSVVEALRDRFSDRSVVVVAETTPSGKPEAYVTLSERGMVLSATSVNDLFQLFEDRTVTGLDSPSYRPILDYLDETLFTSWAPERMLTATREIEDRAWRLRRGRLYVGFQTTEVFRGERKVYQYLADSDLELMLYTTPDGDLPEVDGATITVSDAEELARCWFLAYDGAGEDNQKCALLAEEREPRSYYGFWTYEPDTVDRIIGHLESTYHHAQTECS